MTEPSSTETPSPASELAPGVGSAHVSAATVSVSAAPVDEELPLYFKLLDGSIVKIHVSIDESMEDVMTRVAAVLGQTVDTLRFVGSGGRLVPGTDVVREHWNDQHLGRFLFFFLLPSLGTAAAFSFFSLSSAFFFATRGDGTQ